MTLRGRLGTIAVGLALILFGVAKMDSEPAGMYTNYWGGQVYAPFVILAGSIAVIGAFVRRAPVRERDDKPVEFPHETVQKPWTG